MIIWEVTSPKLLVGIGYGVTQAGMSAHGWSPQGEENVHNPDSIRDALHFYFAPQWLIAYDLVNRADEYWLTVSHSQCHSACKAAK